MDNLKFELKTAGDEGSGTFEGVMSAPVVDRDDEIVDFRCFDPLPAHITIDIDHGLTVEKTVGSGVPYYDDTDGLLKVKGTFASTPLGQLTRTLVKEGHIRHMSVAFRGAVREVNKETGIVHIVQGDLINCTITGIPANTATLVNAKVGARNAAKDLERLQATHDHMVELGAVCEGKHAHVDNIIYGTDGSTRKVSAGQVATTTYSLVDAKPLVGHFVPQPEGRTFLDFTKSTDTETPTAAAPMAAPAGAEVDVARALAALTLARAALALE